MDGRVPSVKRSFSHRSAQIYIATLTRSNVQQSMKGHPRIRLLHRSRSRHVPSRIQKRLPQLWQITHRMLERLLHAAVVRLSAHPARVREREEHIVRIRVLFKQHTHLSPLLLLPADTTTDREKMAHVAKGPIAHRDQVRRRWCERL